MADTVERICTEARIGGSLPQGDRPHQILVRDHDTRGPIGDYAECMTHVEFEHAVGAGEYANGERAAAPDRALHLGEGEAR